MPRPEPISGRYPPRTVKNPSSHALHGPENQKATIAKRWRPFNLVEQSKTWKNRRKLPDSFDFAFDLNLINPEIWRDLYEKQSLSAAQIAEKFGTAKSSILALLHRHGIRCESAKGRSTSPDNYRAPSPPYGYKVRGGKLVEDTAEQKVIRLIVRLGQDREKSWSAIAHELNRRGIPTKRGRGDWHHHVVRIIFERWHKKI
jgi:hypothetical protein